MTTDYRADHACIPLHTSVLNESSNASLRPLLYNSVLSQSAGLHVEGDYASQIMQGTYGLGKLTNTGSPISPLSPRHSSPSSEPYSRLCQKLDKKCYAETYSWNDNSYQNTFSDCQRSLVQGPCMYENMLYNITEAPVQNPSTFPSLLSLGHKPSGDSTSEPYSVQSVELIDSNGSQNSLQHMLEEIETALMGPDYDDTEVSAAVSGLQTGTQPGNWIDTFDNISTKFQYSNTTCKEQEHNTSAHLYAGNQQHHSKIPAQSLYNNEIFAKDTNMDLQNDEYLPNILPFEMSASFPYVSGENAVEQLLVMCAEAIDKNDHNLADVMMVHLKQVVSIYGAPLERLAAYMAEGLVARIASSGLGIYKALKCKEASPVDLLSAMQKMYEICPYFKFGFMAANGAIVEAFKGETKVHIIDFQIAFGTQWISLIQALASRPGGPPSLRITGIGDREPISSKELEIVGQRLSDLAKAVGVPFEFHPLPIGMTELQLSMFDSRPGEAVAVNFTYQLHHMPDESVCITNPRDQLLRMVRSLNPKVLTLVEQEANTNTALFVPRFLETMSYYSAIFESIDVALPRDSKDRVNVEQQCLARDIVNIIACEGTERVERHELMGKWRARLLMAGFKPHLLSSYVNSTIKALLELYNGNYCLKEEAGALFLGWLDRPLVVASAWH